MSNPFLNGSGRRTATAESSEHGQIQQVDLDPQYLLFALDQGILSGAVDAGQDFAQALLEFQPLGPEEFLRNARLIFYFPTQHRLDLLPAIIETILWDDRYNETAAPPKLFRRLTDERRAVLAAVRARLAKQQGNNGRASRNPFGGAGQTTISLVGHPRPPRPREHPR